MILEGDFNLPTEFVYKADKKLRILCVLETLDTCP